jgi:hypothetical protein
MASHQRLSTHHSHISVHGYLGPEYSTEPFTSPIEQRYRSLIKGGGVVTAGIVARVWRCFITVMARRSGHDPPYPFHTALMTGIAAPWRHHPAMDHSRPAEGRRGLVTGLAGRGGREVVCRLGHHPNVCTAMTGRAARHYSRMVILGPRKRRCGLVTSLAPGGGWEVVCRLGHHPGISAAMAGRTTGHDPGMIHRCPRPKGSRRLVTGLAPQCRWYVSRRLAQRR